MISTPTSTPIGPRVFARIAEHPGIVLTAVLVVTALLVIPFLTLPPTESASTEPGGDVFTARDRIDETFVSSIHTTFVIAEQASGDLLRAEPLARLLTAHDDLRADPEIGPTLFAYYEPEATVEAVGVLSLAELVDSELRAEGIDGIAAATDTEVKTAGAALIDRLGERSPLLGISPRSTRNADGTWTVPAISYPVLFDNDVLGFGNISVNLGGDTDVEEFDRSVQEVLRTADGFQINGVAIDVNLTSQEQGAIAGPFIGFTILAVLVLVGLTFRSYWVLATVSVAFVALIIWLKGISNLIGLEDDLVLSLIVPVAMISFGVDFAFHSIGRYREERSAGRAPRAGYVAGMSAVSGALLLALTSDTSAFLANLTSGIESIDQFGIGAAIALSSAYLLLGIVTPLVVAHIEEQVPVPASGRRSTVLRIAAGLAAAALTMTSVLLLVFILPWLGVVFATLTMLVTLALPYLRQRSRPSTVDGATDVAKTDDSGLARPVGRAIARVAGRPRLVLPVALTITAAAAVLAVQVPAAFDVEDFFSPDTDFVVSLDQLDRHVGDRGGEPAQIYVEGDLADPDRLAQLASEIDGIRALDSSTFARDRDGIRIDGGIFAVFDAAWESPVMVDLVADRSGVRVTDVDGNRIPDDRAQIEALLSTAAAIGVPLDTERLLLTPDDVTTSVTLEGRSPATVFDLGLVDSRAQESVAAAKNVLDPVADRIAAIFDDSFVQVTGSPFVREASLDATNRALQVSLPVALLLCLIVATVFLRSVRYGVASIVPIVMVVAWLYAFMELAGYAINLVTATIAAVSIGIGIDFAIHFIARYREELARRGRRADAVRIAGEGTGLALVASAVSSAVGFGILALAPMPLFAAYGLLTALMIVMALAATLLVLPSVLVLITCDVTPPERSASTSDGGVEVASVLRGSSDSTHRRSTSTRRAA